MQSWKFSCKSWQLSSAYLHSAEICWEYLCIHVLCVPEDFRTQLFAFKCICKCSVKFLNLTLYTCTCKFSSIEGRWKGWGWGEGGDKNCPKKKIRAESSWFLYNELSSLSEWTFNYAFFAAINSSSKWLM